MTASTLASCSSNDDAGGGEAPDAGLEASITSDASTSDVSAEDAPRDAAPFDGGPLPIVCGSSPCALSLAVTYSTYDGSDEGFCVRMKDRTVACWGANGVGQLGRGADADVTSSATAARVVGLADVVHLEHSCALDESGAIWCWGRGPFLQNDAGDLTAEHAPVKLPLPPATSMSIGSDVGCALVDGRVLCWGSNARGQVARFDSAPPSAVLPPTEVVLPPGPPIRSVAVGGATFASREGGSVVSWGANALLARVSSLSPDPYPRPIELDGISSMEMADLLVCGSYAGVGYCWGPNFKVGPPQPVVAPEPIVQIAEPIAAAGQPRWCAVAASGAVYCWGPNASGQAGDGTKNHAYEAVRVIGLPAPAVEVRTTLTATCALLTNGKVYCFGANSYGQLGNGAFKVPSLVPQEVVLP